MNRSLWTLIILSFLVGIGILSQKALDDHPMVIFLLGGQGSPEAFRAEVSFGGKATHLEPIPLDRGETQRGKRILETLDLPGLRALAKEKGGARAVLAVQGEKWEDSIPWYLGGGIAQCFKGRPEGSFDDLGFLDRIYLALFAGSADTPPARPWTLEVAVPTRSTPSPGSTPGTEPSAGPLRVEIQNGCGIKGAADWMARRLEGHGLKVVATGNAPNFRYPTTLVKTTAGRPVALEEALERIGYDAGSMEEVPSLAGFSSALPGNAPPVDVLVIIGRDFRSLKAKALSGH